MGARALSTRAQGRAGRQGARGAAKRRGAGTGAGARKLGAWEALGARQGHAQARGTGARGARGTGPRRAAWACCWAVCCALGALSLFLTWCNSVLFLNQFLDIVRDPGS